jgi:hypothetical protein
MAAVDFPASPAIGQIFSPGGGLPQYVWTGTVWNSYGTSQPKTWMSLAASPPANPADGDFWWQTDTGLLFVRYNDGNTVQWVAATPAMTLSGLDTRYKQIADGGVFKVANGGLGASAANIDITLPAGYAGFELMLYNLTVIGAGGTVWVRFSLDGTTFYSTAVYGYELNTTIHTAINTPGGSGGDTKIVLTGGLDSSAAIPSVWKIIMPVPAVSAGQSVLFQGQLMAGGNFYHAVGGGIFTPVGPPKAVRILTNASQFAVGSMWQLNGWK